MKETLVAATIAFAATNIDDIFVLTFFFAQSARRRPVVIGQYLGFTVIIAVALVASFGSRLLPQEWIHFLGVIPIVIGIRRLFAIRRPFGHHQGRTDRKGVGILTVAAVTFANGGDNIGTYTPLFAISTSRQITEIIVTFYLLVGVWCILGWAVSKHWMVQRAIDRFGRWIAPAVLVGLGIYILRG